MCQLSCLKNGLDRKLTQGLMFWPMLESLRHPEAGGTIGTSLQVSQMRS